MIRIRGIYEIAIPVKELSTAESFYRNVLGFEVGLRDETRRWLFLRVGGTAGMIVLQETPENWQSQHFAFAVSNAELDEAINGLQKHGVVVDGPCLNEWMPARSVYFSDVDGHQLELCALVE
jgi:lactoylglutathione lyase